jgi:hypothetical protein
MMWFARYQWNFLGRDLPYSQSDVEFSEKAVGSFAIATLRNRSPYTRFSSAGGGQLDGFEEGRPGQYSLRQYLEEFALKYRGFSVQQEFHWKEVIDNVNLRTTRLRGTYVQAGLFPWGLSRQFPKPLEFAFRYGWVDPDCSQSQDDRQEVTVAVNWFFSGHDNKLTADFSLLTLKQLGGPELRDQRVRVQWDISF